MYTRDIFIRHSQQKTSIKVKTVIYNHGQNIRDKLLFLCEIPHYGKTFQQFFASIDKIFILGGRLGSKL